MSNTPVPPSTPYTLLPRSRDPTDTTLATTLGVIFGIIGFLILVCIFTCCCGTCKVRPDEDIEKDGRGRSISPLPHHHYHRCIHPHGTCGGGEGCRKVNGFRVETREDVRERAVAEAGVPLRRPPGVRTMPGVNPGTNLPPFNHHPHPPPPPPIHPHPPDLRFEISEGTETESVRMSPVMRHPMTPPCPLPQVRDPRTPTPRTVVQTVPVVPRNMVRKDEFATVVDAMEEQIEEVDELKREIRDERGMRQEDTIRSRIIEEELNRRISTERLRRQNEVLETRLEQEDMKDDIRELRARTTDLEHETLRTQDFVERVMNRPKTPQPRPVINNITNCNHRPQSRNRRKSDDGDSDEGFGRRIRPMGPPGPLPPPGPPSFLSSDDLPSGQGFPFRRFGGSPPSSPPDSPPFMPPRRPGGMPGLNIIPPDGSIDDDSTGFHTASSHPSPKDTGRKPMRRPSIEYPMAQPPPASPAGVGPTTPRRGQQHPRRSVFLNRGERYFPSDGPVPQFEEESSGEARPTGRRVPLAPGYNPGRRSRESMRSPQVQPRHTGFPIPGERRSRASQGAPLDGFPIPGPNRRRPRTSRDGSPSDLGVAAEPDVQRPGVRWGSNAYISPLVTPSFVESVSDSPGPSSRPTNPTPRQRFPTGVPPNPRRTRRNSFSAVPDFDSDSQSSGPDIRGMGTRRRTSSTVVEAWDGERDRYLRNMQRVAVGMETIPSQDTNADTNLGRERVGSGESGVDGDGRLRYERF